MVSSTENVDAWRPEMAMPTESTKVVHVPMKSPPISKGLAIRQKPSIVFSAGNVDAGYLETAIPANIAQSSAYVYEIVTDFQKLAILLKTVHRFQHRKHGCMVPRNGGTNRQSTKAVHTPMKSFSQEWRLAKNRPLFSAQETWTHGTQDGGTNR